MSAAWYANLVLVQRRAAQVVAVLLAAVLAWRMIMALYEMAVPA